MKAKALIFAPLAAFTATACIGDEAQIKAGIQAHLTSQGGLCIFRILREPNGQLASQNLTTRYETNALQQAGILAINGQAPGMVMRHYVTMTEEGTKSLRTGASLTALPVYDLCGGERKLHTLRNFTTPSPSPYGKATQATYAFKFELPAWMQHSAVIAAFPQVAEAMHQFTAQQSVLVHTNRGWIVQ